MYKLTALLPSGQKWVTNSSQTVDLIRIATNLGSVRFKIERHGEIVYSQKLPADLCSICGVVHATPFKHIG